MAATESECLTPSEFQNIRESLATAEGLARASLLTSPSVERRLRARQMELNSKDDSTGYVPPKHVLLYLVRMGSFTSTHTYDNEDHEDSDIALPESMNSECLLAFFEQDAMGGSHLQRAFLRFSLEEASSSDIRVMQWNILSQTLGQHYDKFALTPRRALDWKYRRLNILREIVAYMPDVICLQEVDHFEFLKRTLETQGYEGMFYPKPDSPCLYVEDNNGPDGCAIFYLKDRFEILMSKKTVLPVWTINSNQVAITVLLKDVWNGNTICIATTHLKARSGALMSSIRKEQGRALLDFVRSNCDDFPMVICGDFNAEPNEPVHDLIRDSPLNLASVYAYGGKEPAYTSWKVREDGEHCQTLDYIFYSKNRLNVKSVLKFPESVEIGETRLPSLIYPSDHLSLVSDLSFK